MERLGNCGGGPPAAPALGGILLMYFSSIIKDFLTGDGHTFMIGTFYFSGGRGEEGAEGGVDLLLLLFVIAGVLLAFHCCNRLLPSRSFGGGGCADDDEGFGLGNLILCLLLFYALCRIFCCRGGETKTSKAKCRKN